MRLQSPLRVLAIAVGLLTASAAGLLWWQADRAQHQLRTQILAQAEQRSLQLADAMGGQVAGFLSNADQSLQHLRRAWIEDRGRFDAIVRAALGSFPEGAVSVFSVTGADGYLAYSSRGGDDRMYVGERDHFKTLSAGGDRLVIGKPVLSRISGEWAFVIGRPILVDGQFQGAAQLLVSSDYLAARLARLELSQRDVVALAYADDGTFMARSRDNRKAMGTGVPKDRPFLKPDAPDYGIFRAAGLLDGTERTYGWRLVRDYGLIVAIGLDDETVFAPLASGLSAARGVSAGLAALLVLVGVGVVFLLYRLAGKQEQFADSEATLRLVVDNAPMKIAFYDADLNCRFSNRAYAEFRGLSAAAVIGKPMQDIVPGDSWREFRTHLPRLQSGEAARYRIGRADADGRPVVLDVALVPYLPSGGKMQGVFVLLHDITEQAQAEERLRATLDNTPGVAVQWFDREGRVLYWNPASERLYGIAAAQAVGRTMLELLHTPEQYRGFVEMIAGIEATGTPVGPEEIEIRSLNGVDATVLYTMFKLPGEPENPVFVCMDVDVSERKRAEQALRASEARFRSVFEQAAVGMTLRALDGRWIAINDVFARLLGYSIEELHAGARINHPEDHAAAAGRLQAMSRGEVETYQHEKRYVAKDGRVIWVDFWASVVRDEDRRPVMRLAVAQDITAKKRAEEELRVLNAELEQRVAARTAELAAANRELETFAYSVSHDLKAPLRGIDGYSRLLLEDHAAALDEEGRRFLHNVRQGARNMSELIEDLLAYSRIERGGRVAEPLALKPLVRALVAELTADPATGHCRVDNSVPELQAMADREGLTLAVRNLLDNAVKFTIRTPQARIEVGARDGEGSCILWVRDNGPGFDMKYHDRIFGVFERLHRTEDYPGTGVGLAIVQKAMVRMGGRVWAESVPGQGATFYLEIPK